MANITTYPFASQAAKYGADLSWTPMVHTDTIINNWPGAKKILDFHEIDNYLVQIVGSKPERFAESVKIIEKELNPLGIDLNFACPDKNIVKSGCGGALMQDPERMFAIIKAAKAATNLPISVKTRAGWDNYDQICPLTCDFKELGVEMVTVHPRTVKQAFSGKADWGVIKKLKEENPDILICGSGDIQTWQEALEKQKMTGCDGILIGRAALGKPWIFKEITEKANYIPDLKEIKSVALDIAVKSDKLWGDKGIMEGKKHFAAIFRGSNEAADLRRKLMLATTYSEIKVILDI